MSPHCIIESPGHSAVPSMNIPTFNPTIAGNTRLASAQFTARQQDIGTVPSEAQYKIVCTICERVSLIICFVNIHVKKTEHVYACMYIAPEYNSLVPRPRFPQLRMDYITATWKVGLGFSYTKVVLVRLILGAQSECRAPVTSR